jgi:uncharacterized protein (DUF58 family)
VTTAETLRHVRQIEFKTRRLVDGAFAGAYQSVFKGRGISFEAVRPYSPGDDVRDIDWKVTARTGEPYIKRHIEERELTVMLMLDSSASSLFGTLDRQKRDLAAEMGAVLAFSAISNNDRVGLLVFSDQIELYVAPRKGRNHALRLIRDLLTTQAVRKGTDLSLALRTVNQVLKQHTILFLMSDFLAAPQSYSRDLLATSRRHDLVAVVLSDPREENWPGVGLVGLSDAETGEIAWIDTADPAWQKQFEYRAKQFQQVRDSTLARAGVDRIDLPLDGNYARALLEFFRLRARRSHS